MRNIFLILIFAPAFLFAQNPCGNDIAPRPDTSIGISFGSRGCGFKAPGVDTILTELQDPARLIEWIHQDGYMECGYGYKIYGEYVAEWTSMCKVSHTSRIGLYEVANPGIISIGGNDFYRYLAESIKPDKSKTYNAGHGDAAPAYCGCLRRVTIEQDIVPSKKIEYLYTGKAKPTPTIK